MTITINYAQQDTAETCDLLALISNSADLDRYCLPGVVSAHMAEKLAAGKEGGPPLFAAGKKWLAVIVTSREEPLADSLESFRLRGAEAYRQLKSEGISRVMVKGLEGRYREAEAIAFLEGMMLGSYCLDKYRSRRKENAPPLTLYLEPHAVSPAALEELRHLVKAVALAKNLVNTPGNMLDAEAFSRIATEVSLECGFTMEVLDKPQLEALGMGGLLGVNKGSKAPPTFNIMRYCPERSVNSRPLVLVGKGVTYDTGGYSLKLGESMLTMKSDMSGGAAVLGALVAVAQNRLPCHVIGIVPATDNKIGPDALVADDIITMYNGMTVEVQNTDAEGRLILADALSYASQYDPDLVIDLATLTKWAAAITGPYGIALMGNHAQYGSLLCEAGRETYERLVELPLWKELGELVKSDIADLRNVGGAVAGASVAGKFLECFTDYSWLHLDMAGPAFLKAERGYRQKGASGIGVRLLYCFIKKYCQLHDNGK